VSLRQRTNAVLKPLGFKVRRTPDGLRLARLQSRDSFYLHKYRSYDDYRATQIRWNREKLGRVFADDLTLANIAFDAEKRGFKSGICHGARNGYEVEFFRNRGMEVIGTDISDTCLQFPHMVVQDFHEPREEWLGKWDFVYTNSLDHSFDPRKALETWAGQLTPDGRIYIEHTRAHEPARAGATDPFGASAEKLGELLTEWGFQREIILLTVPKKGRVTLFVCSSPRR
jgi:SAM-dependent methyltransferase